MPQSSIHTPAVLPAAAREDVLGPIGTAMKAFTRHEIPIPFPPGRINTYVGDRTVVDPGPAHPTARAALDNALDTHGLAPGDVERVVLTHAHVDHFGQARRFQRAGARVVASRPAEPMFEEYERYFQDRQAYFSELLHRHGIDEATVAEVLDDAHVYLDYASAVPVDCRLRTNDTLDVGGTTLTALVTDGHAIGELLLISRTDDRQEALVGDHVLGDITPNPVLHHPYRPNPNRPKMVVRFVRSLRRLREFELACLFPGHGEPIPDPGARIGQLLDSIERRSAAVVDAVDGPTTAFEIVNCLFGDVSVEEYFAGMSEAIGHLEALEHCGRLDRIEHDTRVAYRRPEDDSNTS
jgi:glyoxylase-like metal-dependent hydrolase (beta-lactamase superfamily II)